MECKCYKIKDILYKCWFCLGLEKIEKVWNKKNKKPLNKWSY